MFKIGDRLKFKASSDAGYCGLNPDLVYTVSAVNETINMIGLNGVLGNFYMTRFDLLVYCKDCIGCEVETTDPIKCKSFIPRGGVKPEPLECYTCKHVDLNVLDEPCKSCEKNYMLKWEAKPKKPEFVYGDCFSCRDCFFSNFPAVMTADNSPCLDCKPGERVSWRYKPANKPIEKQPSLRDAKSCENCYHTKFKTEPCPCGMCENHDQWEPTGDQSKQKPPVAPVEPKPIEPAPVEPAKAIAECRNCRYVDIPSAEEPCKNCRNNYVFKWAKKEE